MKIIYANSDGTISVIHPTQEALETMAIEEIAIKDTPTDVGFWIVDDTVIPTDRTFREAWEIDTVTLGEPHGFGGQST